MTMAQRRNVEVAFGSTFLAARSRVSLVYLLVQIAIELLAAHVRAASPPLGPFHSYLKAHWSGFRCFRCFQFLLGGARSLSERFFRLVKAESNR
jgi:hypothetical protein